MFCYKLYFMNHHGAEVKLCGYRNMHTNLLVIEQFQNFIAQSIICHLRSGGMVSSWWRSQWMQPVKSALPLSLNWIRGLLKDVCCNDLKWSQLKLIVAYQSPPCAIFPRMMCQGWHSQDACWQRCLSSTLWRCCCRAYATEGFTSHYNPWYGCISWRWWYGGLGWFPKGESQHVVAWAVRVMMYRHMVPEKKTYNKSWVVPPPSGPVIVEMKV